MLYVKYYIRYKLKNTIKVQVVGQFYISNIIYLRLFEFRTFVKRKYFVVVVSEYVINDVQENPQRTELCAI